VVLQQVLRDTISIQYVAHIGQNIREVAMILEIGFGY